MHSSLILQYEGASIKYVRTEGEGGEVEKSGKYAYDSTDSLREKRTRGREVV